MGQEIFLHLKVHFQKVRVRSSVDSPSAMKQPFTWEKIFLKTQLFNIWKFSYRHIQQMQKNSFKKISVRTVRACGIIGPQPTPFSSHPLPLLSSGSSTSGRCSRENRGLPLPLQSPHPSVERMFHSSRGKTSMCVTPLSWKLSSPGKCSKKEPGIFSPRTTHTCREEALLQA